MFTFFALTAIIGAAVGAVVGGVKAAKSGESVWKGALKGAAVGGLIGLGAGLVGAALITGTATASTAAVLGTASVKLAATGTTVGIAASKGIDYLARGYEKVSSVVTGATNIYRSVGAAELADIQMSGQFNVSEMGMQSKQFAFSYAEVLKFGSHPMINQTNIVSASVPNSMLNQFYLHNVDYGTFTGIMTVYGEQMELFNTIVDGTIRIMP